MEPVFRMVGGAPPARWSPAVSDSGDARATWLEGESHGETRALEAESAHARAVWRSAPVSVRPDQRCLVSGFIRPSAGSAWLVVEFRNAEGKRLGQWRSPRVGKARAWTYVAVETTPLNETWLVHNVFYLLAVTALHEANP
jgi:hypothetical protein